MDTFFEQIVRIKKSGSTLALVLFIWFLAISVAVFLFFFPLLGALSAIVIIGILYGAWWLSTKFNVEYEYIVTNEDMDVDKIINKSARKRLASITLSKVERVEKFNPALIQNVKKESLLFACDQNDPNAYLIVTSPDDSKVNYIVFSPNEKLQAAIKKSLPKFVANSAFK
ncbi:MAG: hypothetical protein IKV81_05905 [Clostridia bacterium]|nr:hypothetical protein [Clostridia bacterium]